MRHDIVRSDGRIVVRPFVTEDAQSFFAAVRESVESLSYWFPWCYPGYSQADAESWIRYCLQSWESNAEFPMGIFDAATGDCLGGTGINHLSRAYNFGNLGYWVCESRRANGIASAAARFATDIAFTELKLTRLEIFVLPHNVSSQHVAEKLGATREGIARNRLLFQGRPSDAIAYSLIPSDLFANEGR
ncbi:MAG TPA: GNAT family protein [Noviherbaspirillum sp.]|nr:GNAT family protein [Noviherbaspirillum sp.]